MKMTLAEAVEIKRRAEGRLFSIPGVHMVGFGPKIADGRPTNEFAILVYVFEKKPKETLRDEELIPSEIQGIKTDVIQMGTPELHALEGGTTIVTEHTISGELHGNTGTLGCLALTQDTNPPKAVLLSNDHVLYGEHGSPRGSPGSPVKVSCCSGCCDKTIATVGKTSGPSDLLIDAAIAELEKGVEWLPRINKLPVVGTLDLRPDSPTPLPPAILGAIQARKLKVKKFGAKTGYTIGEIQDLVLTCQVENRPDLKEQLSVWPSPLLSWRFSDKGDSGSVIYVDNSTDNASAVVQDIFGTPAVKTADKVKVVALLWGGGPIALGGPYAGFGSHIETVSSKLKIKVATNSPAVVYRVGGQPIPHPALARIQRDLSGTDLAKQLVALYSKYANEFTHLLRNNRRFVVAWHRNYGPQIVRSLIEVAENRRPFLPEKVEGQSWADSMEQVARVLLEIGSPELRADILRFRPLATRLGGRSYEEVLGFLVVSEAFTPNIGSEVQLALNQ